jgi:acetyl esterase/lipase
MKTKLTLLLTLTFATSLRAQTAPGDDARFQRFDKNNDGRISAEELGMPTVFPQADKDGDGFVTPDEFAAYLEQRPGQRRGRTGQRRTPFQLAVPDDLVVKRDIGYRETPGVQANLQSLDIYAPQDAKDLPVMIYIHGGGWQGGDKAVIGSKPAYFCSRGLVFVSLNYRLVPAVDLLTQLQDSADAIAWVHTHIAEHGGDPQRLHLMGHSAGAHHVAILATNDRFLKAAGKHLSILKSVVELDTQALDVPRMMQGSETAVYGQAFGEDERLWREVSPLHHVVKGKGIPTFFLVVADNREQKLQQAAAFQKALQAAGVRCQFVEAPEHDHGSLNRAIGEPGDKVTATMEQFLTEIEPGMKTPARDQSVPASIGPKSAARPPLSGSELHDIVKQYAALGDHRTASEVDRRTADWLANLLRQVGLQVEFQDFEVPQFQLRAASLKVAGQNVECFPVWPPKATEKPVVAPLTVANAASLHGKIALITENPRLRRDEVVLLQRLVAAGVAGAVILDARGEGTIHAPNVPRVGEPPEIPMLYAANNDRESLSSAAQRGDEVELFIDGEFQSRAKARNVVATLERGPKRIVVSTPYSGWFRCGGERGSGLAMFVSLARWAASRETEFSYTFLANSAHELGCAGMTAFLEHQAPESETVVCWLHLGANVALLPEARPADGARPTRLFTTNPAWEPLLTPVFRDVPWVRVSGGREPSGELALVVPEGYAALNLAGGSNRWMHSSQDGAETTGPDVLQPLALALAACLEAIESHQP